MHRPNPVFTALYKLALALLFTACGAGDSSGPGLVRIQDHLGAATVEGGGGQSQRTVLIGRERPDEWVPVVRLRRSPTPDEIAAFEAASEVTLEGDLVVGQSGGGFVRVVPVEGGEILRLTALLSVEGARVGPDDPAPIARIFVAHRRTPAEAPPLPLDEGALIQRDESEPTEARYSPSTVAQTIHVHPEARSLAVLCAFEVPGGTAEGEARFRDVQLVRPGFRDLAAELLRRSPRELEATLVPSGEVVVGRMARPGFFVAPGDAVRVRVPHPGPGARLEAFGALPAPPATPRGRDVLLSVEVGAAGAAPLARSDVLVAAAGPTEERWWPLELSLPAELEGAEIELRFAAAVADGGEPFPSAPFFGGARLVAAERSRPGPNVLLISIDTLRGDRCGWLGYPRDTTPRLDALAAESVRFPRTWTTAPYTLPSHASLFSGQLPSVHGVQGPDRSLDPARSALLTELLAERGYLTAGFTGGGFLDPQFGFAHGFDQYSTVDPIWNLDSWLLSQRIFYLDDLDEDLVREGDLTNVARWMREHADEPLFVFVHTFSVHEFDPPPEHLAALGLDRAELSEDDESLLHLGGKFDELPDGPPPDEVVERISDLYDGAIHFTDARLGAFLDELRGAGLLEDTLVVLVSDHGKELGERGTVGHGVYLSEEMVSVPLLIRVPGEPPRDADTLASLVDVLPTVLGALGLEAPPGIQGRDLLATRIDRPLFAEVDTAIAQRAALRRGNLKVIWNPLDADTYFENEVEEQTYDLDRDPGESAPLPPDQVRLGEVQRLRETLRELGAALGGGQGGAGALDPALVQDLEALGYGGLLGG